MSFEEMEELELEMCQIAFALWWWRVEWQQCAGSQLELVWTAFCFYFAAKNIGVMHLKEDVQLYFSSYKNQISKG